MGESTVISQKQFSICLCSVVILLSILTSAFYIVPTQAAIPGVSVVPSSLTTGVGQNFNVNIAISNVLDLYAWEFELSWNMSLLDAVNVVEGPFLKGGSGPTFFTYNISSIDGRMVVDCTLLGMIPGVSGNGILSTVTFYPKNAGESPLGLYNVSLIDSFEQSIPCQTVDGYWYAIPPHDVAITRVDVSPTALLPGDIVGINVTVQNQGGFAEVFNVTTHANASLIGLQQVTLNSSSLAIVPFTWNTAGYVKGDYTIQASAGPVQGEIDTADNTKTAGTTVTILTAGHDIAVTHVGSSKTVVGQGYSFSIIVTVKNYGVFGETFNVTAYVNSTAIETRTVALASGEKADLLFVRNTSSMAKGNFTLSAGAGPVPGETETADNTATDGLIVVTIPGDLNGDRRVDIYDAIILSRAYNSIPGKSNWNSNADVNSDNVVDIYDAILISNNFGKTSP